LHPSPGQYQNVAIIAREIAPPKETKPPVGVSMSDITMDQFMDLEDGWSRQEEGV
jgi:hypothetical protein